MSVTSRKITTTAILAAAAILFVAAFSGCAQGTPEIRSSQVQLLRIQNASLSFSERLSVFVFFQDSDGEADFSRMTITHNETGLVWAVDKDQELVRMRGKDRWTGSNMLAGPGGDEIPGGPYTLSVYDLAGNEAVRTFNLIRPEFPERAPLKFSISGKNWTIDYSDPSLSFSRVFLMLLDRDGNLLYSWRVPPVTESSQEGSLESLQALAKKAVSVQCFVENSNGSAGILFLPVPFPSGLSDSIR